MTLAPIVRFLGNRQPPISGQILTDGLPVDVTSATVTFYMRAVGSATLKVTGAAVVVDSATQGQVHYNPAAADVDTVGFFVGWWRVTLAGGTFEETPEFLIQFVDHVAVGAEYVSVEELKTTRSISKNFADLDVQAAVQVASRFIDGYCNRSFTPAGASETRKFTPVAEDWLTIDDAVTISAVSISGSAIVLGTDYVTPLSAAGWPFTILRTLSNASLFPRGTQDGVSVTGTFGWPTVPPEVKMATKILAGRVVQLVREGAMVGLGYDGSAIALGLVDGAVASLLRPYKRTSLVA